MIQVQSAQDQEQIIKCFCLGSGWHLDRIVSGSDRRETILPEEASVMTFLAIDSEGWHLSKNEYWHCHQISEPHLGSPKKQLQLGGICMHNALLC